MRLPRYRVQVKQTWLRFPQLDSGGRLEQQIEMVARAHNHLKLRYQVAHIGRLTRAAFVLAPFEMVARPRNQ